MNYKLIFYLSIIGIVMGFVSVLGWLQNFEPLVWLIIFVIYAFIIAKRTEGKRFQYGFLVSLLNGVWIAAIHSIFYYTYLANNPSMQVSNDMVSKFANPRLMQFIFGPFIGAFTGLILGTLAWTAGYWLKWKTK